MDRSEKSVPEKRDDSIGRRARFGTNQRIALLALAVPFVVGTSFVLVEVPGATAEWWGNVVVDGLVPTVTLISLGGSAVVKAVGSLGDALARRKARE
jgi:hypothetical protein